MIHITKRISQSGLCSRREAKAKIFAGEVKVNGKVVTNPAIKVSVSDKILVDNKPISTAPEVKLWLYNKAKGVITTHRDPQNRPTVFASLPKDMPRVVSVGRLDINSEGLLLLTNQGELARFFELPKNNMIRRYKVRVFGKLDISKLQNLSKGCIISDIRYGKIEVKIIEPGKSNSWLEIILREGKNREIRKVMEHLGLKVSRLIRLQYGPYLLEDLSKGHVKETKITKEIYANYIKCTF
jgi:23S rRNA pseudouridine2605 synthase